MLKYTPKTSKSNLSFLREINEARIFNMIREEKQISRIELSKRASMSKTTVSEIIGRLLEEGMIYEEGKGKSTVKGGKRPVMLQIKPEGGYVFGIQIKRTKTLLAIADLNSEILTRGVLNYEAGCKANEVLEKIFSRMQTMLKRSGIPAGRLISIGIAIPGFVDDEQGKILYASTLEGWDGEPIVESFRERFDIPVYMENDINVLAWAEFVKGAGLKSNDMLCINIGDGLGAGIIENSTLVRGLGGGAGEIGFLNLNPYRIWLKDNWFYTGQNMLGDLFTRQNLLAAAERGYAVSGLKMPLEELTDGTLNSLILKADSGDPVIDRYTAMFAEILGLVVSSTIIILGSSMVVLSGHIFRASERFNLRIMEKIKDNLAGTPFFEDTQVQIGVIEEEETLRGTIELAMEVFKRPYGNGVL